MDVLLRIDGTRGSVIESLPDRIWEVLLESSAFEWAVKGVAG